MTRRDLFHSAAFGPIALSVNLPQTQHLGVDTVPYREYARCLPDYLRALAAEAFRRRGVRLKQLSTRSSIHAYQGWARTSFLTLFGGIPQRTPLNTKVTGGFERAAYRVEKLVYESQPGLFITANLYLPRRGRPPFPAVLFQMGHSPNGKAADFYQRFCQGLVHLGYIVLAFDPMGQGERTNYPDAGGYLTRLPASDDEHTVPGKQMLLVGNTATQLQVWDAVRSLDVLAAHPLVDPARMGPPDIPAGAR